MKNFNRRYYYSLGVVFLAIGLIFSDVIAIIGALILVATFIIGRRSDSNTTKGGTAS